MPQRVGAVVQNNAWQKVGVERSAMRRNTENSHGTKGGCRNMVTIIHVGGMLVAKPTSILVHQKN